MSCIDIHILRLYITSNMSIKAISMYLNVSCVHVAKIIKNKKNFIPYHNFIKN